MGVTRGASIKKVTAKRRVRLAKVGAVLVNDGLDKTNSRAKGVTEGYAEDVAQIVRCVTEKTAAQLSQITDQSFQLIMSRFDTIEDQNKEQSRLLADHAKIDAEVHEIVKRHATYFSFMKWGAGPTGIGAALAAWFGFHK